MILNLIKIKEDESKEMELI